MYCNKCGKDNPDDSNYCVHCAAKISNLENDDIQTDRNGQEAILSAKFVSHQVSPYPYAISFWKLIILDICTLGLYDIYWFYKQFKSFYAENNKKHSSIIIWLTAFFYPLSSYSLFKQISNNIKEKDEKKGIEAGGLAFLLFFLRNIFLGFICLIPVQKSINYYWESKYGDKLIKSKFGIWNFIAIIISLFIIYAITINSENYSTTEQTTTNNKQENIDYSPQNYPQPQVTSKQEKVDNSRSVVNIVCDNERAGSGTIWTDEGGIVTNYHVVKSAGICLVTIPDPTTGTINGIYTAEPYIVTPSLSELYDIAVIFISGSYTDSNRKIWGVYPTVFPAFKAPATCTDTTPHLGDSVRIYGYPVTSGGYNLTVTEGIISSFTHNDDILTSAKIDSGNSGGLSINLKTGCFVGIPSAVISGNYQNLGVIIPYKVIMDFFEKAKSQSESSNSQSNQQQSNTYYPTSTLPPTPLNTPTIDPDTPVHCPIAKECGGGTKPLKKRECDNTVCCKVSEESNFWMLLDYTNTCPVGEQTAYP